MTQIDTLRAELSSAFANRGDIYRLMRRGLVAELGTERAETIIVDMLEERGREVAGVLFKGVPAEADAVTNRFLSVSPDGGRLFPHDVERAPGACTIRVRACPLKDAWTRAGLPDAEVADLCRLAGAFDRGLFEAAGVVFSHETWSRERGGGCCWITLKSKP